MNHKNRTVKIFYLHTNRLFSHSVYSREVNVCWIILYGWMLGFCLFILCLDYCAPWYFGSGFGLYSQANVTVEVVLHLLGSILWHTFKYFVFSKMKRNNRGFTDSCKDTAQMFGGLFLLNIVKNKQKTNKKNFQRTSGAQMESLLLEGF